MFRLEKALEHVDEKLHAVVDKGDHIVIGYHFMTPETFQDSNGDLCPIRTQFRGICFDKETGRCIRLPFHKFFNLGENNIDPIDWNREFQVMDKLDGSLVAPYRLGGRLIWGTKSGETDMSKEIEAVIESLPNGESIEEYAYWMTSHLCTPIFEYVSPDNRVVIPYENPDLVLLAVRNNETGKYSEQEYVDSDGVLFNIKTVKYKNYTNINVNDLVENIRNSEDTEGVVVRQGNNIVKIKSLWYVQLHKNKEYIEQERNVVHLILSDSIDDVLPLLQEDQKTKILSFVQEFWNVMGRFRDSVHIDVNELFHDFKTRKEAGLSFPNMDIPALYKTVFFKYFDRQEEFTEDAAQKEIIEAMQKSLVSIIKYDTFKETNDLNYQKWRM